MADVQNKSNMFPGLHPVNLKQLKAVLNHPKVKEAWFHANGNIYVETKLKDGTIIPAKQSSDDAKIFVNDNHRSRPAKYRHKFVKGDEVPATLKEMEDLLVRSFQEEEAETEAERYMAEENNFVFTVESEEELTGNEIPATSQTVSPDAIQPKKSGGKKSDVIAAKLAAMKESNAEVQTVVEVGATSQNSGPERIPVTSE